MTKPKKKQVQAEPPSEVAIQQAISAGSVLISDGKTKAEAAMAVYRLIGDAPQETVVQAFISAASLTPKGALTYWYNCKRKIAKEQTNSD